MSSFDSIPGQPGITAIVASVLAVSALITLVTSTFIHWLPVTAAIIVGLLTVRVINR